MKNKLILLALAIPSLVMGQTKYQLDKMQMERLDRGVVVCRTSADSVMIQWRYLRQDPKDISWEVKRDGKHLATVPARHSTTWMDALPQGQKATYSVTPITRNKAAKKLSGEWTIQGDAPIGYVDIPLDRPEGMVDVSGRPVGYVANDASMADLDGDGQMEIVLKWDPTNSKDNSQSGITNNTLVDAYKLNGKKLWRIDLGRNIRSGAHYTQFMVYDLDGDGCAEVVMKTGDGTVDGQGKVIGDANADHRVGMEQRGDEDYHATGHKGELFRQDSGGRRGGFINRGNEYLTVFNGVTGAAMQTVDYVPARGNLTDWGDNYANRSDRFLACVAYLDGRHPSVVMGRGYYTRMTLAAWDWDGKELKQRWFFDSNVEGRQYAGQGNHNLRVGDVDGDGCDEITCGSAAVDHDGHGLYSTGMGHGDAMHLTAFMPLDDALQVWDCHENKRDGSELRDARTGKIIFQIRDKSDVGRCMAADVDPNSPGLEMWSSRSGGIRNVRGEVLDAEARIPINFAVWWDGDLTREMLDHETVSKYMPGEHYCAPLLKMEGCQFNNGTKSNPTLACDIVGDWREEVLVRTSDSRSLRLYITPESTPYRFHTFLQDPVYRLSVTYQNVAYNQPTQVGFYFGAELQGSGREFRGWKF